ncbi:hypothetical protein CCR94_08365 [Rhodoblastus sphagnicola]|uniref:Uncharacterized protein n=1 Tax=Rhodoblastus sphagnicola TaxID=333368 RepID=A0A2S6NAN9_9HYPH|nr:heparinase II/III family protein [Rhodoblastus sphagnicola]MBB4200292.1 putative heparinase superfamily protein [Rhodoblastus sphagnicola]PPQ31675.1 hypothetical protein CCR94_08365 [Rhodoblastus sphagnicola]
MMFTLERASRLFEFARRMPLPKLARRVELAIRRQVRDRLWRRPGRPRPLPPRASAPPAPLFAARRSCVATEGGDLRFTFLNRAITMPAQSIDWSAPSPAPADQLWRMNLHYLEYLEGADDNLWRRIVADWIAGNPQTRKGAWRDSWNSYALSLRVVVLMQELHRRGARAPKSLRDSVEASVVAQIRFLERNLETDLGGNHLIKNIKALIWASAYFANREAERWRRTGLDLLARELKRQILPDGMHNERSASYHAQVFADLLECRHALGEDPLDGRLDQALDRMARATADLAHPDGGPTLFNDSGLTMAYAPDECLEAHAALTGRSPERRRVFALRDAGYFGMRTKRHYLVVDCGRIAPDDLPAHGHADVLSFEWSVDGRRILVDQGVFEYFAGQKRRRARSAASHNTLCIEGTDQADFFGSFRCGRRPNVTLRDYARRADGFCLEGSHDGFRRLPGGPVHVRRFEADARSVRILDRVEGELFAPAHIGFLLHPDVRASVQDGAASLECRGARAMLRCNRPIAVAPAVWWPDMGCELTTLRLSVAYAPRDTPLTTQLEIL